MRLAILGAGKMGEALARGILRAGLLAADDLVLADVAAMRVQALAGELCATAAPSNTVAVQDADMVLFAVKPHILETVCREVAPVLPAGCVCVSIAAGVTLQRIAGALARDDVWLARAMPNTPCLVGAGAIGLSYAAGVPEHERALVHTLLATVGIVEEVSEHLLNAITGLSGSGPAYIAVLIDALADGGVLMGLPRAQAERLATQTVLGTATLQRETGQHPAQLKDAVTTPNGTTAAGLTALEAGAFRHTLITAVRAAAQRAAELAKE